MKQFFPRVLFGNLRSFSGNKMKRTISRLKLRSPLALVLICFAVAAALLALAVSASREAKRAVNGPTNLSLSNAATRSASVSKSNIKPLSKFANRNSLTPLLPPLAPAMTGTLTDSFPLGSKKNPGATINYTAVIGNLLGTANATGVTFTDTLDNNTTLVGGSVISSPLAFNDSYTAIGNVLLVIPAGSGVLTNDTNPTGTSNGALTVTSTGSSASANSGTVTMNADGSFNYDPPRGFSGTDTFTYTLGNGTGLTDTGTVTITISGMIWFINNNSSCISSCDGRLSHPYLTLAAFQAVNNGTGSNPAANQNIFLYESGTTYGGPVTLLSGQKLIGQDSTSSLLTITGLAAPSGTNQLPAMNTGAPASTIISASNDVNLNSGNTLNGFTAGAATGIAISGSGFGTLTVADVIVNTTGQGLSLTNGTLAATFTSVTSSGGTNNIALATGGTTLAGTLTINGGALSNATSDSFIVSGTGTSTATISDSGTIASGGAHSVNIANKSGGTVTLSGLVTDTDTGITLTNNTNATINFTGGMSVSTGANAAFTATGGGTVTATSVDGTLALVRLTASGSNYTSLPTVGFSGGGGSGAVATVAAVVGSANVTNGGSGYTSAPTVTLTGGGGSGATAIALVAGGSVIAVNISNAGSGYTSAPTVGFSGGGGSNAAASTTLRLTSVNLTSAGSGYTSAPTVSLTGGGGSGATASATLTGSSTLTTTTATALNVANTTIGAGGLIFKSISSNGATTGISLNTTGSGALTVTGTITGAGSGGTVQNCTQKGADFRSVSNITLNNMNFTNNATANLGAATTCGDALNGTNGPTNCNSNISLLSATTTVLNNVTSTASNQIGIDVNGGSNLTLTNVTSTNNGDEVGEDGVQVVNLGGTLTVSGGLYKDNAANQFEVQNGSGALTVNVDGATFSNTTFPVTASTPSNTTSNSGLFLATHSTATMSPTITNCTVDRIYAQGIRLDMAGSSSMTANIGPASGAGNSNNITNSNQPISITGSNTGGMTYNVRNNTTNITVGVNPDAGATNQISVNRSTASGTWTGLIENNTTGTAGQTNSTCQLPGCQGIDITNNSAGTHKLTIQGNSIHDPEGSGMSIISGGSPDSSSVSWIIKNNTITNPDENAGQANPGIIIQSGTSTLADSTDTCLEISGNTITGTWSLGTSHQSSIRVRSLTTASGSFAIVGFMPATDYPDDPSGVVGSTTGGVGTLGNVADYIRQQNPGVSNHVAPLPQNAASANQGAGSPAFTNSVGCPLLLAEGGVMAALNAPSIYSTFIDSTLNASADRRAYSEASHPAAANPVSNSLSQQQLDSIVSAAIQRWSATGLAQQQISALRSIKFEIADLQGAYLGEADGDLIRVDTDAAGNGWFVDPTPFDDGEFAEVIATTRRNTDPYSAPAGHLDLLTAVMHELGHRIGLPDTYALLTRDDLMYGYLVKGERRLPRHDEAKGANLGDGTTLHFLSLMPETETVSAGVSASSSTEVNEIKASRMTDDKPVTPTVIHADKISSSAEAKVNIIAPQKKDVTPLSGETVGPIGVGTLPIGKTVTIKYDATVNNPPGAAFVQTQGTVHSTTASFVDVLTTDPETGTAVPTRTNINVDVTWIGVTSTDWDTAGNWLANYVPLSFSDVKVPNAAQPFQPTLSTTSPTINSLNLGNTRVLTISGQILAINGSTASDLTLDGTISGGALSFGGGTHGISNAISPIARFR